MISLFVCSVCTYNEYCTILCLPIHIYSLLVEVEETSNKVHIYYVLIISSFLVDEYTCL